MHNTVIWCFETLKWSSHSINFFFTRLSDLFWTLLIKIIFLKQSYAMSSLWLTLVLITNFNLLSRVYISPISFFHYSSGSCLCPKYKSVDIPHRVLRDPIATPLLSVFLPVETFVLFVPPSSLPIKIHLHEAAPVSPISSEMISNLYWVLGLCQEWCKVLMCIIPFS